MTDRYQEDTLRRRPDEPFNPADFETLFNTEDRHFWFKARNRVITTLVRQATNGLPPGYRVLEVGCGTGNVLRYLEEVCARGTVFGMDLFAEGLLYARTRTKCPLVQGDIQRSPFGGQFDVIGCFDVLEHLPDDIQILRDLHALLARNGILVLTVPASRSLWSYFDEASRHCRRYEEAELHTKLDESGFQVEYLTPFMATIFPLVWLGRRVAALRSHHQFGNTVLSDSLADDELRITPVVNEILEAILTQESRLIAHGHRLPIGTSLVAVARKSSA